ESPRGYDDICELAKRLKRPRGTLIALTDTNDPYYADREGVRIEGAHWFAAQWERVRATNGMHLRRLHYMLVSGSEPPLMPTGKRYENRESCWQFLRDAPGDARFLDLVRASAFSDRRAREPLLYVPSEGSAGEDLNVRNPGTARRYQPDTL